MARGYTYAINSDASGFISGARKAGQAAEDFSGSLEDVARNAGRTDDDVQQAMKNISADAKGASNDLEQRFSQAFEDVRKDAKRTGDTVDTETRSGTRRAGEGVSEFKNEAVANFSEVSSSFSGDMTSAVDLIQGTLGGLAGSIPGLGLGFAALGALVGGVFAQNKADAEAMKEAVAAAFEDMKQSGADYLSESLILQRVEQIVQDQAGQWERAKLIAEQSGQTLATVLRGMAGDAEDADRVTQGLASQIEKYGHASEDAADGVFVMSDAQRELFDKQQNLSNAQRDWNDELERSSAATDTARQQTDAYRAAVDAGRSAVATARDEVDKFIERVKDPITGSFRIDWDRQNRDEILGYLTNMETLVRSITGDKTLRISRGLGGAGGMTI